jgi:hypothetical protein
MTIDWQAVEAIASLAGAAATLAAVLVALHPLRTEAARRAIHAAVLKAQFDTHFRGVRQSIERLDQAEFNRKADLVTAVLQQAHVLEAHHVEPVVGAAAALVSARHMPWPLSGPLVKDLLQRIELALEPARHIAVDRHHHKPTPVKQD